MVRRSMLVRTALPLAAVVLFTGCEKKDLKGEAPASQVSASPAGAKEGAGSAKAIAEAASPVEKVEVPEVRIRADAASTVRVTWITPKGTAVNDDAPFRVRWNRSDGLVDAPADVKSTGSAVKDGFRVNVRPMAGAPNATLDGEINIVVCDAANHAVCVPVKRSVGLGFVVVKDAGAEATVAIPLPAAK